MWGALGDVWQVRMRQWLGVLVVCSMPKSKLGLAHWAGPLPLFPVVFGWGIWMSLAAGAGAWGPCSWDSSCSR